MTDHPLDPIQLAQHLRDVGKLGTHIFTGAMVESGDTKIAREVTRAAIAALLNDKPQEEEGE